MWGCAYKFPGIFLLARLICDNLYNQATLMEVYHELEPNVFPREINDAYVLLAECMSTGRTNSYLQVRSHHEAHSEARQVSETARLLSHDIWVAGMRKKTLEMARNPMHSSY